jgi:hypothetical protein
MQDEVRNMKTKEVGGVSYDVFCLPPLQALELKATLLKIVLPTVGALLPNGEQFNLSTMFDGEMNMEAALGVFSLHLQEKSFVALVETFLKRVQREGNPIDINVEFMGRTGQLLLLFWACLEVNYADFFDVLKGRAASLGLRIKSEKPQ